MSKRIWSLMMVIAMLLNSIPAVVAEGSNWVVTDLKVNQMENPMTIDDQKPSFSWRMESAAKGAYQTAYQLRVLLDGAEVWNTGKVTGDAALVVYAGKTLLSASRYDWEVTVWNETGEKAQASSWFETAFMDSAEFDAALISAVGKTNYSGDYTVEYDTLVTKDSAGFIFAGTDAKNNMALQVNIKSNTIGIIKTENGRGSAPASWSVAGEVVADTVHIKLSVSGTTVTVYANGTKLGTYNHNLISFGVFGFRHYNSTNDQETAYYDNLTVTDVAGHSLMSFDFTSRNPFNVGVLESGRLYVAPINGNYSVSTMSEMTAAPAAGFTLETDFKIDSTAFSVAFGGTDARNLLFWQINIKRYESSQKVYLRPHQVVNGAAATLAEIDVTAYLPWAKRNEWHHLKIAVGTGGEIKTYLDDALVDTRTNSLAAPSQVGFRQTKSDAETAWVDNYVLKDAEGNTLISADFEDHIDPFSTGRTQNGALYLDKTGLFMRDVEQKGAPLFRTEFALESGKKVAKARLYASSLGTYQAYINGQQVGDDRLAPGWTEYFDRIDYQAYDVTSLLQDGDNAIGAVVGNGWYAGHVGEGNCNYQYYGVDVAFKGQLIITYTDGSRQVVRTDESWYCTEDSPYLVTDHSNGETYDASREQPGWNTAGFDDSCWKAASLATGRTIRTKINLDTVEWKAQPHESVKVFTTITPKSVTKVGEDTYIIDMGQNFAGVVTLKATGVKGQTVRLRYGEMLYDANDGELEGRLYTANLRTAHATDYYIFGADGTVEYTPYFTYHGFRYVEVTGLGYEPKATDVLGVVWSSVSDITSSLNTSSSLVNQLYSNTKWSQLSNYVSVPTDCPQRDERLGWSGDAQVFAGAASFNADVYSFLNQYLSLLFSKQGANGGLPDFAPTHSAGKSTGGTAGWSDAAIVIPYTLYKNYGDTEVIEKYYDNMKAWISCRLAKAGDDLIIDSDSYGDWLSSGESTPVAITSTNYLAYSVRLLAEMAAIIGNTGDAAYYEELFCRISDCFKNSFLMENGRIFSDSQTSYALSLGTGILNDPVLEKKAAARLAEKVRANGNKLTTGFLGTNFLCSTLTEYGYADVAYDLLLQTEYPSWGYSIVNGATTIWERWNSYTAGGGLGANSQLGSTMNSYNHYCYGSIVQWMYEEMAGIKADPADPGYHHVIMKPQINNALEYVSASYDSQYGTISSNWTVSNGRYVWMVTVPANATATVYAPSMGAPTETECVTALGAENGSGVYEIKSGTYTFIGTLPEDCADPSALESKLEKIDPAFYQKNYANTTALVKAYEDATAYLTDGVYTDKENAAHIAALENSLKELEIISEAMDESMVTLKDYAENTDAESYQITTVSEWLYFTELVDSGITFQGKTVYLKRDLDFEGFEMSGVGVLSADNSTAFMGTFEGGWHMLKNVNIYNEHNGTGVFDAAYGATIRCLGVSGSITGTGVVGGIAGYADGGSLIEYCWNEARVISMQTGDGTAGIAGNLRQAGTIRSCYNVGAIIGPTSVAGICSWGQNGSIAATIASCYNYGTVTAVNGGGETSSIIRYNGTVTGKTSNSYYLDTNAGNMAAVDGTFAASATAFADGTVAAALSMAQGDKYPVFEAVAEQKMLENLIKELEQYDLALFTDGSAHQQALDAAKAAYAAGTDYASHIAALDAVMAGLTLKNSYPDVPDIKDYALYQPFGGKIFGISDRAGMDQLRILTGNGTLGTNPGAGYTLCLLQDIDMGNTNYEPVAKFYGCLDGKGHALYNLKIEVVATGADMHAGVINSLVTGGVVQNLGVAGGSVTLINQKNSAFGVGAIVGSIWRGNVYNCWNAADITAVQQSTGDIYAGGIVGGFNGSNGTYQIVNCYNTGTVNGGSAGGIVGSMGNVSTVSVLNCLNTGTVTGNTVDAIVNTSSQNVKNVYYTAGTSAFGTRLEPTAITSGEAAYLLTRNGINGNVEAASWSVRNGAVALGDPAPVKLTYQAEGETVAILYTDAEGRAIGAAADPQKEGFIFLGWENESTVYTEDTILTARFKAMVPGDADGNDVFNTADVIALMQYLNNWDITIYTAAADANGDGRLSIGDAVLLLQRLAA